MAKKPPRIVRTDKPFSILSTEADLDYLLARHIAFLGSAFHKRAGFLAHQAIEKYLKSATLQASGEYAETHELQILGERCVEYDRYFAETKARSILEAFDAFDQVGRYGAAANFDPLAKNEPEVVTKGPMVWSEGHLDALDEIAFRTRSLLRFESEPGSDYLSSILSQNPSTFITATWTGEISLLTILTRRNRFFAL